MEPEIKVKKKLSLLSKILIILVLSVVLLYVWMHYIETKIITVKDFVLTNEKIPKSFDGFTIVQFSDIHFGRTTNEKEVNKVVEKINDIKPDIVLFSGDLFDPYITLSDNNINFLKDSLKKIKVNFKKYAVYGDKDIENKDKFDLIMKESNFEILNGENKAIYYKGNTPIFISGISSITKNAPDYSKAFKKSQDSLQLFLSHEPSVIIDIKNQADFIFSGHTLGGLVNIPFMGGLFKQENSLNYESGKYLEDKTTLFVNNGIGTENYSLRFLNFPTIYCYRLKAS